ncbi:MAG: hypothetical protein QG670_785 [Thermoproteota archaeon]|nr:hypothetical protein [Thermoproteota archaeon]
MLRDKARVTVNMNGPYTVYGNLPLNVKEIIRNSAGEASGWSVIRRYPNQRIYTLCRCGKSRSKPFCDGTHDKKGFDEAETASLKRYFEQAEIEEALGISLADVQSLCAASRFCHGAGGIWNLLEKSGDPKIRKIIVEEACNCASGRLVAIDKQSQKPIEPLLEKAISLVEDPIEGISGPIRLEGGVELVSHDGKQYETRNRITICRCGKSKNKPFCDSTHVHTRFKCKYKK